MPAGEDEAAKDQPLLPTIYVNKEWLLNELLLDKSRIVVLDCRSSNEYGESHIRDAVNFSIPSIMLRRLANGKIDLASTIRSRELKEKIMNVYKENIFVVYADMIVIDVDQRTSTSNDTMHVLIRRLLKDGCRAVCLQDGFAEFRHAYPEWCEACNELLESPNSNTDLSMSDPVPLMGLRSLRISNSAVTSRQKTSALPSSSTEESSSDSEHPDTAASLGFDDDRDFPVEIVPFLYLGNAANSVDLEALSKHGIEYILNVTPDLPNKFENDTKIKYMKIPITDHWTQNLAFFFPKAIQFIDEARSQKIGVLVHCLAGVSRSVTITVAYLMSHMQLSLNDAFSLVRARKSNVGPNFHFMEQLHAFEQELMNASATAKHCEQQLSIDSADGTGDESGISSASSSGDQKCDQCGTPQTSTRCSRCHVMAAPHFVNSMTVFGQSPDSGIEFDRWTPGSE